MPATCPTDHIVICGAPIRPFSSLFVTACLLCYKHTMRLYVYSQHVFSSPVQSHRPRSENNRCSPLALLN